MHSTISFGHFCVFEIPGNKFRNVEFKHSKNTKNAMYANAHNATNAEGVKIFRNAMSANAEKNYNMLDMKCLQVP